MSLLIWAVAVALGGGQVEEESLHQWIEPPLPMEQSLQKLYLDEQAHLNPPPLGLEEERSAKLLAEREFPLGKTVVVLIVAAILCGMPLLFRWLRRYWVEHFRKKPSERALEALELLKSEEDATEAFVAGVEILRWYLEKAWGVPARQATAKELLGALEHFPALPETFKTLMTSAERAKFAQKGVTKEEAKTTLHQLSEWISTNSLSFDKKNVEMMETVN